MGKQGCEEGPGICSVILTLFSVILVIATLPFSLLFVVKVVQVSFKGLYQWIREAIKIKNCRKNGIGIIRLGGSEKILNIHHLQMMKKHVRSLRVTLLSLNPMSDGGGLIAPAVWKMSSSSVSFDFWDQKTKGRFFFNIFIDTYAKGDANDGKPDAQRN